MAALRKKLFVEEIWKDIAGYEGLYQVSNLGRVRSLDRYIERTSKYGKPFKQLRKGRLLKLSLGLDNLPN